MGNEKHPVSARARVWIWLIGGVIAALIPFLPTAFQWADTGKGNGLYDILGHGELIAISAVLVIAGIVELGPEIGTVKDLGTALAMVIGSAVFAAVIVGWYIGVVDAVAHKEVSSPGFIAYGSMGVFVFSAVLTSRSVYLAAGGG